MNIEYLHVENFRVFQDTTIKNVPALAVFMGQNGTGKTTFFDIFGFLHECLTNNVRSAINARGGYDAVISREQKGSIKFVIKFRPSMQEPLITYELSICLRDKVPVVEKEIVRFRRGQSGAPWKILNFAFGEGDAAQGNLQTYQDVNTAERKRQKLFSPDVLAIKGLGQFEEFPAIMSLRRLIEDWYVSDFHVDDTRGSRGEYGESLSKTGHNLAQVAKFLYEAHPNRFAAILLSMQQRIPGISNVEAKLTDEGNVALRFQDGRFKDPFAAKFVSDGTIKMFMYLVLLNEPNLHALLCVEEPENQLYPNLLRQLAEEFRNYSAIGGQVFVSTHSPDFLNSIKLGELFCLVKRDGYTRIVRMEESNLVQSLVRQGDMLGELWNQGILLEEATQL